MQEILGEENAEMVRVMGGLGSGIGGSGSVCGAIIAGVAALSSKYGKGALEEKEDGKLFPLCAELYRRFATEIEISNFCRDITGTDFTKPEQVKAYVASPEKLAKQAIGYAEPRATAPGAAQQRDLMVQGEDFQNQLVALAKSVAHRNNFLSQPGAQSTPTTQFRPNLPNIRSGSSFEKRQVEIAVRNDRPAELEAKWATAAGRAW